jgi:hypothetical protein
VNNGLEKKVRWSGPYQQMEHWQVLKLLMVTGFGSEITQDEICQMKNDLVFKKKGMLPQWELFLWIFSS